MSTTNTITDRQWGSKEWFGHLLSTQGHTEPWAYFCENGYQKYRHARLVGILQDGDLEMSRGSMLDIGCGTGALVDQVARALSFEQATGIDFVEGLVEHARQTYPDLSFEVASLPDLPFESSSRDLVLASMPFRSRFCTRSCETSKGEARRCPGALSNTTSPRYSPQSASLGCGSVPAVPEVRKKSKFLQIYWILVSLDDQTI